MKDLQDLCVEIHKTLLRKIKDDTNRQTNEVHGTQGSPLLHLLELSCTLKATLRKALRGFLHGFLGEQTRLILKRTHGRRTGASPTPLNGSGAVARLPFSFRDSLQTRGHQERVALEEARRPRACG